MAADYSTNDRGFKHYDPIETTYGHKLRVYESSAIVPHLWLAVEGRHAANGDDAEVHAHLTIEQAERLRDVLDAAIRNHYQADDC